MEFPVITTEPTAPHTHTIIFLHGRGDNATNFLRSLHYSRTSSDLTLFEALPSFRFVFPSAPLSAPAAFPLDRKNQWFDVWNVTDLKDREELQAEGLRESVLKIRQTVLRELEKLGGNYERIVLAGISQGGATSVHTLLNLNLPSGLGAFVGFCCRMPFPGRSLSETRAVLGIESGGAGDTVLKCTPMLLEHCVDDPLVKIEWGRDLRDTLRGFGASVEWKEYPDGGHWFKSPEGMDDAVKFLREHVPGVPLVNEATRGGNEMDLS